MKITQNKLSIGELKFRPFNSLKLTDVYVEDLQGDTLLYAGKLSAGFDLWKIFNNQLLINSVELQNFVAHIVRETPESNYNFQFLIDAFASSDTTQTGEASSMLIEIDNVFINNGIVSYDILSEPALTGELMDFNHIYLSNINAELSLKSIDIEKLNVEINEFMLKERSGLILENLAGKIHSKGQQLFLDDLEIRFPETRIQGLGMLDYSGLDLADLLSGATYSLQLSSDKISLSDFRAFYSDLSEFPESISFSAEAKGKFPEINLPELRLVYGNLLRLEADAFLSDFNQWQTAPFKLNLANLSADKPFVDKAMKFTSAESDPKKPIEIPGINAVGEISGSLPDFRLDLTAKSNEGNLQLNGKGGYLFESGHAKFDIGLITDQLNLASIMSDATMGIASVQLAAKGSLSGSGKIDASACGHIKRFDFLDYSYKDISLDGRYVGDSVRVNIVSEDENIPIELHANANIGKQNPAASLYLNMGKIHLDTLNLMNQYNARIAGLLQAEVTGFDPEKMTLALTLDSLSLETETGSFEDNGIKVNYTSDENTAKDLQIKSRLLNIRTRGKFTFAGVEHAVKQAFPVLFPNEKYGKKQKKLPGSEDFNLVLSLRKINAITPLLNVKTEIPDSALFILRYKNNEGALALDGSAFCLLNEETDTLKVSLGLSNKQNNLEAIVGVDNRSQNRNVNGKLHTEVEFIPKPNQLMPDMQIGIKPTTLTINGTDFKIRPSEVFIAENRYEVRDFAFEHLASEYIRLDGVVSKDENDAVTLSVNNFRLSTILAALKMDMPLSGVISGDIVASNLLNTPSILTRKFAVDSIVFGGNTIGNLSLMSGWSAARQGIAIRASLQSEETKESLIQGFYIPETDSLMISGNVKGLKLAWLDNYLEETIYGLGGELAANFKVLGSISKPSISGMIFLDQATMGVKMLNTLYTISDSVQILPNALNFRQFTIRDERNKTAIISGRITHKQFANITPTLGIRLDDFMVMNNATHTDSLFYGNLRLNGQMSISAPNNEWLLRGNITHGHSNRIMINLPSSPMEAQRYSTVTFINTEEEENEASSAGSAASFSFPIKAELTIAIDPNLTIGAIYNPSTGDLAQVKGNGLINFSYDLTSSEMDVSGNYKFSEGSATLSLQNIKKETLKIQEGSELTFLGDPLKTEFDITAVYSLRADLAALDNSFTQMGLSNTRVPVNCALTVSGSLDNMKLGYDINLPNQSDDVKRKVQGIIYTDDLKIKQIAYLLAVGSFMPSSSDGLGSSNIWTNIASSSITSQLNSLLAGVLSENWSIGTDLHTSDSDFSQVDMDVNVSTHLLDNRLTINTTFGYTNDAKSSDNFTGDFDVEYKLIPSGNILLQFYNRTNNQYNVRAKMIQGVGIVYRRESKTFKDLFQTFRKNPFQPNRPDLNFQPREEEETQEVQEESNTTE